MSQTTPTIDDIPGLERSTGDAYGSPPRKSITDLTGTLSEGSASPISPPSVPNDHETDSCPGRLGHVDTDHLVETITTTADTLTAEWEATLSNPLQQQVEAWCELHGWDSVANPETKTHLAQHAVFNLLLKTTLYEWHHQYDNLPALPPDTRAALRQAKDRTDNPAFAEYVLDDVAWLADQRVLTDIIEAREQLLESDQPAEDIGQLYTALMPTESRQTLGQFWTPSEVGELMRTWATSDAETVLDPGLGAGGLSSPRHPFWIVQSDPTQVVDVVGIDRSPLALLMGTTALTLAGQAHEPRITDFLDLVPEDLSTSVDALVCNPPYTSTEALPAEYKHDINTRLERETGRDISNASPLYAYFLYHAREFLSPGARAAFITPQSFLATNYGEPLKEFLLDEFDIQALLLVDPTSDPVFDEVMTTGLITFLKATAETDATGCTRFIRVDETPSLNTLQAAVNDGQQGPTDWGYINCVPQRELTPERNWQALFDPSTFDTTGLTPLSEFVTVHRGVTTGNTGFFCLSQDTVDQRGLDEQHLSRLARWSRCIDGYEFRDEDWEQLQTTGAETWLFDPDTLDGVPDTVQAFSDRIADESISVTDTQSADTDSATNIRAYLREGVTSYDLDTTDAVKNRPYWYRPKRQESARVLVTYASRDGFTFILNEADVRHINSLYGFYDVTVDETELKALLAYLNSDVATEACREQQRARQGGFEQLEPNKLEAVLVIDPTALPDDIVTTLAAAFDTLRETVRRGDDPDPVIDRIDTILQQEL